MPRYIIERDVGSLTQEELEATGRKSNEVLEAMTGVVWIRSYISAAEGKIYCEYDAPNPKAIPLAESVLKNVLPTLSPASYRRIL